MIVDTGARRSVELVAARTVLGDQAPSHESVRNVVLVLARRAVEGSCVG